MKVAHVSKFKREKGHLGGVEKFASHLKRVFPGLEIYGVDDVPEADGSDLRMAKTLNAFLLAEGLVGKDTIVIADGFWMAGLEGKVKATVNVSHGTWVGIAMVNEAYRFGSTADFLKLAKWQEASYAAADAVVAVSPMAQWELKAFYGIDSVLICNGVDLDMFHPGDRGGTKILHVASPGRKQLEMVEDTAGVLGRPIEYLNVRTGNEEDEAARWREGRVFFQPSLYEGCSYASLEAMACGLVPVSFRTGLFWNLPDSAAVAIDDHYSDVYAAAISRMLSRYADMEPRKWVAENASIDMFAKGWSELVKEVR